MELSKILCTIISKRLPTREAAPWKKSLVGYDHFFRHKKNKEKQSNSVAPEPSWPIQSVLFLYPGKIVYGKDELVLFELKLFGKDASHEFFIEVILPAMEEASFNREAAWTYTNSLWGNFDVDSIYIANQSKWEPLVAQGKLNLKYKPNSLQYVSDIFKKYSGGFPYSFRKINWLTPFDFSAVFQSTKKHTQISSEEPGAIDATPSLYGLIDSFIERLHQILEGRRTASDQVWTFLTEKEKNELHQIMLEISEIRVTNCNILPSKSEIGRWIGHQTFSQIPHILLPYLELASMVHVGRLIHVGCGTFRILKFPDA